MECELQAMSKPQQGMDDTTRGRPCQIFALRYSDADASVRCCPRQRATRRAAQLYQQHPKFNSQQNALSLGKQGPRCNILALGALSTMIAHLLIAIPFAEEPSTTKTGSAGPQAC